MQKPLAPELLHSTEFLIGLDDLKVTIEVWAGRYSPIALWEARPQWMEIKNNSLEIWNKMSEVEQEGLELIVKHALQRMHDRVSEWLPEGIKQETGSYVDINMKVFLTDAGQAVLKYTGITEMKMKEVKDDSIAMLKDLEAEIVD